MDTIKYYFYAVDEIECEAVMDQLKYDCAFGKCTTSYVYAPYSNPPYHVMAEFRDLTGEEHAGLNEHFAENYLPYGGWWNINTNQARTHLRCNISD